MRVPWTSRSNPILPTNLACACVQLEFHFDGEAMALDKNLQWYEADNDDLIDAVVRK